MTIYSLNGLNKSIYNAIRCLSDNGKGLYSRIAKYILEENSEDNTYTKIALKVLSESIDGFDQTKHVSRLLVNDTMFRFIRLYVRDNIRPRIDMKLLVSRAISQMLHLGKWKKDEMYYFIRSVGYLVKGLY